jgi:hypothetical protein
MKPNQKTAYVYLSSVAARIRKRGNKQEIREFISIWPKMQAYIKGLPEKGKLV